MANRLKRDKVLLCLRLLSEGNSIRSVERITRVHRDTIMRQLVKFGDACQRFLDLMFRTVVVHHAQLDEIWTWVRKKQGRLTEQEQKDDTIGDIYLFTALDSDTKLLFSYKLGKRTGETTEAFVQDMARRMYRAPDTQGISRPQVSTDGFGPYVGSLRRQFKGQVRHGVLIKNYVNPESGRYAPPDLSQAKRIPVNGIEDKYTICTSHVERLNCTHRQHMKRLARLTLAFSKKFENLEAATAMHIATYNFARVHRTLKCTPAMKAGIVAELWSFDHLYDEVMEQASKDDMTRKMERLINALNRRK